MPSRNAIQRKSQQLPSVKQGFIEFRGGQDDETPPLFMPSGFIREGQNVECDPLGGYKVVTGYERFDGRTKPSDAVYSIIDITLTGTISVGDTITGGTSGATAVVLANLTTYLVVTKIAVSTFQSGEALKVGGVTQATSTSVAMEGGASTALLNAQYKNLAADNYRADISAPTGSGSTLGVVRLSGVTYSFRNNAGGTAATIYKSSAAGWVAVPTGYEISFTAAGTNVDEGDTLTQGGVTATIKRIVLTSGSFVAGTAAGRLIIHTIAGGNFVAGAATTTGAGALTLSGAQTLIAILPGGSYEFVVENFGGNTGTRRIYGVDGVNRGFEFDGTDYSYTPISTGMTSDIPTHVAAHKMHLVYSFAGGSVQHAAPGLPYVWSVVLGASEIGVGNEITGFARQAGSDASAALAIYTRNRTYILYGNGVSTWNLIPYREELGAYSGTIRDVGFTIFLDDRGITSFEAAQSFGNFSHAVITERVKTWLAAQRTKVLSSCIVRDRSQYRLFFNDQYALYVTFRGKKIAGITRVYLGHQVKCVWSSEESDGSESIFFGSTNGMIYQMERGTSFDGGAIDYFLRLSYDAMKSPRTLKAFKEAMIELSGTGYASFGFSYVLGYADPEISQPGTQTQSVSFSSLQWDAPGAVLDTGFWDAVNFNKTRVDVGGTAENISLDFFGSSDYDSPIRFSGAILHYIPRRNIR